jgi:L-threonylcarbamoyladenylate synthase
MRLFNSEDLSEAAELLKSGEIIAFPTETVYGLGAPIFHPEAIRKIYTAKGRPQDNPLIVHISSLKEIERIARDIPSVFYQIAEAFFPGPLTVILKRHPSVPALVSAGLDTIAVRMPAHPLARALIRQVGEPLAAPSANLSGKPSSTLASHVLEDFQGKIAAVIDGGPCTCGIESTVLSLIDPQSPHIFRPGVITKEQLQPYFSEEICTSQQSKDSASSPGMKYRHYSPNAPISLFANLNELVDYLEKMPQKKRMLLSTNRLKIEKVSSFSLTMHNLYATLRLCDREKYEEVLIFCDETLLQNTALMNRLTHASSNFHESSFSSSSRVH